MTPSRYWRGGRTVASVERLSLPRPHGVDAKIVRADVHLKTLEDEILSYLKRPIAEFPSKVNRNNRTMRIGFNLLVEPPIPLSIIAGDVVHNLRSALDHLWAALIASTKSGFPCERDSNTWIADKADVLKRVPKGARAFIESLQPCSGTDDGRLIGVLNTLSNRDKHKIINLTTAKATNSRVVLSTSTHQSDQVVLTKPFYPGTAVTLTDLPDNLPRPVRVKINGQMVVAFKDAALDGENVRDILRNTIDAMRDRIVPTLKPFVK